MKGVIRFVPDIKPRRILEFTVAVAERVLTDETIGYNSIQEIGFELSNQLDDIIQTAVKFVTEQREPTEFSIETNDFGRFYIDVDLNLNIFVDTYDGRMQTFQQIKRELIQSRAAYVSYAS